MINEVQLIIAKGEVIIGDVIEPSVPTSSNKIGVNYFEGIESLVGKSITIIDPSLNEYEGGVISVVDFGSVFPGLWNIYFPNSLLFDGASGWTFKIDTSQQYYVDLYENESISQNWSFSDLSELRATGSYSREFRIPLNDRNQEVFGAVANVNYLSANTTDTTFNQKIPAEIRVNTMPIVRGHLRVMKVFKQLNRLVDIQVAFYAETPDLFRAVGEKKLSDIAALATLNEEINYTNVTTETPERVWSLCDRAQLWSNGGEANSRPILSASTPVFPADLTPAVSWWFLLKNIIAEAGFDLVGSSIENIIEDYYMPFCNTPILATQAGTNEYFFRAYPPSPFAVDDTLNGVSTWQNMTEVFDNNGDFNPVNGVYTSSAVGTFTFHVRQAFITPLTLLPTNYIIVFIKLWRNGSLLTTYYRNFEVFPGTSNNTGTIDIQFDVDLVVGDTFFVEFEYGQAFAVGSSSNTWTPVDTFTYGTMELYGLAGTGAVTDSVFELIATQIDVGSDIDYNLNAPDMRQIDFVNDVVKMHNCAIIPSRIFPNQIAIVPQNNYLGTGDVVDWTDKLDISKDIILSSTTDIQKAKFQFTYTAGEDAYSKVYKDANRVYGDFQVEGYTVNPSTPPSDFAKGDQRIQLVTRSTPAARIPNTGTPIPCFYNDNLEFVAPGPRALYHADDININLYNDGTNSATPTTSVPVLNHYSNTYPNVPDFDLNWAPEIPPHVSTVQGNPINNLFNLYWRNYMNDLYSPEGRIMEAFFSLDLNDILTFSFADKIWIEDAYWRILEISDYKVGLKESTKVKLIKFLDQVNDCASTPVSVTTNGEVNFENGDGDPVEPSEDCCSRYGYFWDEVNGVCWAFNNGGQFRNSIIDNPVRTSGSSLSNAPSSLVNGTKVSIAANNGNMLAIGQDLNLTKFVNGSNLLGKNVEVNLPGIHVGGGYRAGNSSATEFGWSQFGQFALHRYPTVTSSGQSWELFIEGVSNQRIELPDETLWSCLMNLTIKDVTGTSETSLHHFTLEKIGGIAYASAITPLSTIGGIGAYTFTIGIDTTTDTDEHRIRITTTGGTYPEAFVFIGSIQYQQSKTA
jgi:hypothetical protein